MLIGLSHTPTTGSMLSNRINLGYPANYGDYALLDRLPKMIGYYSLSFISGMSRLWIMRILRQLDFLSALGR